MLFKPFYFLLEQSGNAVPGQVNLRRVDAQRTGYFAHWPLENDMQVINFVVLRMDLAFDTRQRGL